MPTGRFSDNPRTLVDEVLAFAVREKATDVHFAPFSTGCVVRARVDGLFRDLQSLDSATHLKATSALKVTAELDIAEKRRPRTDGSRPWSMTARWKSASPSSRPPSARA